MHDETLYEKDFYQWTQQQAALIRKGRLGELDLNNILEEIESMGRSEHRQLGNCLDVLLMHLLKWQYQPDHQSSSWRGSIEEQRVRIRKLIKENPSLKPKVHDTLQEAYALAKIGAYKETGLSQDVFPKHCPWDYDQIMDEAFWP
ncbi:hypothetical protein GZ77_02260 [Endozoicomonas montiporae]|uniref:DUF29 domain-containing protein n=2 Tax=Endozoicomonas montiporae TaxID=1027273 RepID=A0A081NAL0_9GAMM|nr:DUF29 domain-containing protein [Endozoicomonas montiporae]AMO56839.1 hypothetical protein EZMO1_2789 [Endozoicomonas montiporae CL-33]KEQ15483.1 hypothetical protein GZ77_02260 [Endozoicomonas montiporae]